MFSISTLHIGYLISSYSCGLNRKTNLLINLLLPLILLNLMIFSDYFDGIDFDDISRTNSSKVLYNKENRKDLPKIFSEKSHTIF